MTGATPSTPVATYPFATVANFRDVGGHPADDGARVRTGLLYRSTELSRLAGDDLAAFGLLGIRRVYDLRTEGERAARPDTLPAGTRLLAVDVLAGASGPGPAELMKALSDARVAEAALGEGRADRYFEEKYRELVTLPSARSGFGALFRDLAEPGHRPALIHCMTGKDRTGWGAAALLILLGTPRDVVLHDYLRSNELLGPSFERALDDFRARGGDPSLLRPLVEVREAYLDAAIDEMERRYRTVEAYFADGLGVGARIQRVLREAFLER